MEDKTLKEQLNRSAVCAIKVTSDDCPNMLPIYRKLVDLYKDSPDDCPTLVVVDNLWKDVPYIKCSDILLLKRGVSLEETMQNDNYYYRNRIPLDSFKDLSYDIYSVAVLVCDILDIKCPQIILSNNLHQFRGMTSQNRKNLTKVISLRTGMRTEEYFEVLFHELRHAWQHEKKHKKFFRQYKLLGTDIDKDEYMMQPAELDAEAFSVYMMVFYELEDYPVTRKRNDNINKEIEKRAREMKFPK